MGSRWRSLAGAATHSLVSIDKTSDFGATPVRCKSKSKQTAGGFIPAAFSVVCPSGASLHRTALQHNPDRDDIDDGSPPQKETEAAPISQQRQSVNDVFEEPIPSSSQDTPLNGTVDIPAGPTSSSQLEGARSTHLSTLQKYDLRIRREFERNADVLWNSSADVPDTHNGILRRSMAIFSQEGVEVDDTGGDIEPDKSGEVSFQAERLHQQTADDCVIDGSMGGPVLSQSNTSSVPVGGKFLIPDSQETPVDLSHESQSRLSNTNISDLIFDSVHSRPESAALISASQPRTPAHTSSSPPPSSVNTGNVNPTYQKMSSQRSILKVPFRSNQQANSTQHELDFLPTSESRSHTSGQPAVSDRRTPFRQKRIFSSPTYESPGLKRPRISVSRRTAEPEVIPPSSIQPHRMSSGFAARLIESPVSPFEGRFLRYSLQSPSDVLSDLRNPLPHASQSISFLSMRLTQDMEADVADVDISYVSGLQKRDFLCREQEEKEASAEISGAQVPDLLRISVEQSPAAPSEAAPVITNGISQETMHSSPSHRSRSATPPRDSPTKTGQKSTDRRPLVPPKGMKLPPFCVLLPSAPRRIQQPSRRRCRVILSSSDMLSSQARSGARAQSPSQTRPATRAHSPSNDEIADPSSIGVLHSLFQKRYPSSTIGLKPFRILCRKLASIATSEPADKAYPPETLFDAYVLEHSKYDRICVEWIQSGRPVIPYHVYLQQHPLNKGDTGEIVSLKRLQKLGFC